MDGQASRLCAALLCGQACYPIWHCAVRSPSTSAGGLGANVWPGILKGEPQPLHISVSQLRQAALTFNWLPAIFKRRSVDAPDIEEVGVVPASDFTAELQGLRDRRQIAVHPQV